MWNAFLENPKTCQLSSVGGVVNEVVAQELMLLYPDGGYKLHGLHFFGKIVDILNGDSTSHAVTNHVKCFDIQLPNQLIQVVRMSEDGIVFNFPHGSAKIW